MNSRARLTLYSKPGCHLCEVMKAEIRNAGCEDLYHLEEINIADDAPLSSKYRNDIPVLLINGVEAFRHRLRAADFRDYLRRRASDLSRHSPLVNQD